MGNHCPKYSHTINESCYPDMERYMGGGIDNNSLLIKKDEWTTINFKDKSGDSLAVNYFRIVYSSCPIQIRINGENTIHDYWYNYAHQQEIYFEDIPISKVSIRIINAGNISAEYGGFRFIAMY